MLDALETLGLLGELGTMGRVATRLRVTPVRLLILTPIVLLPLSIVVFTTVSCRTLPIEIRV